jgi:hypothetical protein
MKAMPPLRIIAPMPTSTAQAGTTKERKASDSANASENTIGAAQASCSLTKSMTCRPNSSIAMPPPIERSENKGMHVARREPSSAGNEQEAGQACPTRLPNLSNRRRASGRHRFH